MVGQSGLIDAAAWAQGTLRNGDTGSLMRMGVAWTLTFALGFERQLRGARNSNPVFPLVGITTALITMVAGLDATTAAVGALTGIGFIGSALAFRTTESTGQILPGATTAAGLFYAAAIGAASGLGLTVEATGATLLVVAIFELRHILGLQILDAHRRQDRDLARRKRKCPDCYSAIPALASRCYRCRAHVEAIISGLDEARAQWKNDIDEGPSG